MVKTKEQLTQMTDAELLDFNNGLVEDNALADSAERMQQNYNQMDLFKEVWLERHGVEDKVFPQRIPRH